MLEVISLKCANCGANLEVKLETTSFACGYCGISQIVERHGGTVSLKLLTNAISKVQVGTDKTAAELAIRRLKEEMEQVNAQYRVIDSRFKNDVNSNIKGFLFGGGIIVLIAFCGLFSLYPVVAVIIAILLTGVSGFFWYRSDQIIAKKYTPIIDEKAQNYRNLQSKLETQKKIVDS
jgi:DNA-directed RNA polymerase subunit RPC12/RpoP